MKKLANPLLVCRKGRARSVCRIPVVRLQVGHQVDVFVRDVEFSADILSVPVDGPQRNAPDPGDFFGLQTASNHAANIDFRRCQRKMGFG